MKRLSVCFYSFNFSFSTKLSRKEQATEGRLMLALLGAGKECSPGDFIYIQVSTFADENKAYQIYISGV